MVDEHFKNRCLIRIIDDDEAVRKGLQFLLSCTGWKSVAYSGGQDFLDHDKKSIPGCVLLDIRMPGLTGIQLQQKLLELGIEIPVIIITGHADVDTAVRTLKKGAVDFLQKPVKADALEEAIRSALNQTMAGLSEKEVLSLYASLSDREKQILRLVSQGLTSKVIGERLGLSERTVQGHRLNLSKKFDVHSKKELIACMKIISESKE